MAGDIMTTPTLPSGCLDLPETKPLPTCEEQDEHITRLIAEAWEIQEQVRSNPLLKPRLVLRPSGSLETK
jgi:hypothetical protein